MGLWGAGSLQVYTYYNRYINDSRWLKAHVALVWVLDTAHEVLIITSTYQYLVTNYGNVAALDLLFPTLKHTIILTAFICSSVQSLFVLRIFHVSRRNYIIASFAALLVTAQLSVTLAYYIRSLPFPTFSLLETIFPLTRAINTVTAFTDTLIAALLVFYLHRSRTGIKQTDSLLNQLILFAVNTGLLTSVCAVVSLVAGLALPNTLVYILFYQCISRLYMNSMMASLNTRKSLRGKLVASDEAVSAFSMSNIAYEDRENLALTTCAHQKTGLSVVVNPDARRGSTRDVNLVDAVSRTERSQESLNMKYPYPPSSDLDLEADAADVDVESKMYGESESRTDKDGESRMDEESRRSESQHQHRKQNTVVVK